MKEVQGLPEIVLNVGGRRLSASDLQSLVSVQVRLTLAQPAQCELTWSLADASRLPDPAPGDALRVEIGGRTPVLFEGEVTVAEYAYGPDASLELRVRAYDVLHRLRKRQHTQVHAAGELSRLVRTLVDGTGLRVEGGATGLGPVYQCARSDLDLMIDQTARLGLFPVLEDQVLRLVDLGGFGEPIDLTLGSTLHAAQFEVSAEPAFRAVVTTRWDPSSATATSVTARAARARADVRADPAPQRSGGGGALLRSGEAMDDGAPAGALAQAELDVRAAAEVSAQLVAEGDPALRAGHRIRVRDVLGPLAGVYTVCEAVHTIDSTGYETAVSTRPPPGPPPQPADLITVGAVARVDDPQLRGRAMVALPAFPDLVTGWVPVLAAGAGRGKGAVVLPDPGDTVLVLLPARDPAQAVVLGGLYGTLQPPDAATDGGRGERFTVQTAAGQRVTLDGHAGTLTLADGHGSTLTLGPDLVTLHASTDLVIEAPGRSMRVRAKTVDFEEAP